MRATAAQQGWRRLLPNKLVRTLNSKAVAAERLLLPPSEHATPEERAAHARLWKAISIKHHSVICSATLIQRGIACNHEMQTYMADAGSVLVLVQVLQRLSHDSSNQPDPARAGCQVAVATALGRLAVNHVENQAAIVAAGAIPLLVELLGPSSPIHVQAAAAGVLLQLGFLAPVTHQPQAYAPARARTHAWWLPCFVG
jgi:hypothetical protein